MGVKGAESLALQGGEEVRLAFFIIWPIVSILL
jgi:hypothetical protein